MLYFNQGFLPPPPLLPLKTSSLGGKPLLSPTPETLHSGKAPGNEQSGGSTPRVAFSMLFVDI